MISFACPEGGSPYAPSASRDRCRRPQPAARVRRGRRPRLLDRGPRPLLPTPAGPARPSSRARAPFWHYEGRATSVADVSSSQRRVGIDDGGGGLFGGGGGGGVGEIGRGGGGLGFMYGRRLC